MSNRPKLPSEDNKILKQGPGVGGQGWIKNFEFISPVPGPRPLSFS